MSADVEIVGAAENAWAGYGIASGDINGDQYVDLVVSQHGLDPLAGTRHGEFDIIWGNALTASGFIDLSNADPAISRVFGKTDDLPLFPCLAVGDFNNDDIDDLVIGQQLSPAGSGHGVAYVILGSTEFPDTLDLELDPQNLLTIYGGPWGGALGRAVCSCDINGDEYDEIIVSAPSLEFGEVYIIHGTDSLPSMLNMAQPEPNVTRIIDDNELQGTGGALACRDLDKDGCDDLVIGSTGEIWQNYEGIVTVVYGESILPDTIELGDTSFRVKRLFGEYWDGRFGESLAVGDIDKDGQEDLIVGSPWADPLGCSDCGEVYVFYSADSLPESTFVSSTENSTTSIIGSRDGIRYGTELLCDDFSADGFSDLVFSCVWHDNDVSTRDTVVVYYGESDPPDSIFVSSDTTVSRICADNWGDHLGGRSMGSADFNRDGFADLALGAHAFGANGRQNSGKVYLLFGVNPGTGINEAGSPFYVLEQNRPNPFSTNTVIDYELQFLSPVEITIFNVLGQRVAHFEHPQQPPGTHSFVWDGLDDSGRKVASGVYFYRLKVGGVARTKKMLLLR